MSKTNLKLINSKNGAIIYFRQVQCMAHIKQTPLGTGYFIKADHPSIGGYVPLRSINSLDIEILAGA